MENYFLNYFSRLCANIVIIIMHIQFNFFFNTIISFLISITGMSRSDAIAYQRQQLKKKLGFGDSMDLGFDSMLEDDDLIATGSQDKRMMSQLSTEVENIKLNLNRLLFTGFFGVLCFVFMTEHNLY